jgi:hypothetical protein
MLIKKNKDKNISVKIENTDYFQLKNIMIFMLKCKNNKIMNLKSLSELFFC